MSATELTAIFVAATGFAAAVIVPLALRRMDRRAQAQKDADEKADRVGEQETVSLQSINKAVWDDRAAIKKDRDELAVRAEAREEAHRVQLRRMEEENRTAIAKVRAECDAKIVILRNRVRDLEEEVANLYRDQGARRPRGEA